MVDSSTEVGFLGVNTQLKSALDHEQVTHTFYGCLVEHCFWLEARNQCTTNIIKRMAN
jgi:hypothetical protein